MCLATRLMRCVLVGYFNTTLLSDKSLTAVCIGGRHQAGTLALEPQGFGGPDGELPSLHFFPVPLPPPPPPLSPPPPPPPP